MKHIKPNILLILFLCFSILSFGQATAKVEMADVLRQDGKIYTVVLGVVVILTAMVILLIRVDRKIFKLEQQTKKKE
jgi:formate-dependent nitrite reductase membrane component NrfD